MLNERPQIRAVNIEHRHTTVAPMGYDGFGQEYKLGCTLADELRFEQVKKEGIGTQRVVIEEVKTHR